MDKSELKSYHELKIEWIRQAIIRRKLIESYIIPSPERREKVKENLKNDLVGFVHDWCYTFDPRNAELGLSNKVPFHLNDQQRAYLLWLKDSHELNRNGLTDKSRGEGMTWLWVFYAVWRWRFYERFKCGFGSYKEQKVDHKDDPDSIFEKIRQAIRYLPDFLKPDGYIEKNHATYMRVKNPTNESIIVGEAGNDIGRGGRNSIYFIDEFASVAQDKAAENALSGNTECIMYGSTPKGTNNLFYKKRFSMRPEQIFTLTWRKNPFKNDEWYDDKCGDFDPVTVAQEIDIDYTASVENIVIPAKWVNAAIELELPESNIIESGFDVAGGSDKGETVYTLRHGPVLKNLKAWPGMDSTDGALRTADMADAHRVQAFKFDADGVGSGVEGTIKRMERDFRFSIIPIPGNATPSEIKYDDSPSRTAKERFRNKRAENWWALRERFRKTYRFVKKGDTRYDADELISIPQDQILITQLSQPTWQLTGSGKIKIESKEDMRDRGVGSPDRADSIVMCFAPHNKVFNKEDFEDIVPEDDDYNTF